MEVIRTKGNLNDAWVKVAGERIDICFAVESDGPCECGGGKMMVVRIIDMRNGQELSPGNGTWKKAEHKFGEIVPPRFCSCIAAMFLQHKRVSPSE